MNIRQERIKRGWSCGYVASIVGVSDEAIRLLESGKRKPSYEVLVRLEDLFGLPHRELFAEAEDDDDAAEKGNKENKSVTGRIVGASDEVVD